MPPAAASPLRCKWGVAASEPGQNQGDSWRPFPNYKSLAVPTAAPRERLGKMPGENKKTKKKLHSLQLAAPLFCCCCFPFGLSGSTIMQNTVILGADRRIYLSLFRLGLVALNKARSLKRETRHFPAGLGQNEAHPFYN